MGRIYGLEDSLDKFVCNDKFQIEIIGEDGCWTYRVSSREWRSNGLQRFVYDFLGGGTCPNFLDAYDQIAMMIAHNQ